MTTFRLYAEKPTCAHGNTLRGKPPCPQCTELKLVATVEVWTVPMAAAHYGKSRRYIANLLRRRQVDPFPDEFEGRPVFSRNLVEHVVAISEGE
jgi:hypothetical protein